MLKKPVQRCHPERSEGSRHLLTTDYGDAALRSAWPIGFFSILLLRPVLDSGLYNIIWRETREAMGSKRSSKTDQPGQPVNRIDALVNELQREGRISELEPELLKFDPASLQGMAKESWHHLLGVAAFEKGNHSLAFERFQEGLRHFHVIGRIIPLRSPLRRLADCVWYFFTIRRR
jgi:hypothetical protein